MKKVDVAIIGAGTAGMRAYREVSKQTKSVALIEGGVYGTTCARVGCMPSKLLIAAAEAAYHGQHTAPFGVHYEAPRIDGKAVMDRVRFERDRFVGFVVSDVEEWPKEHRIKGYAKFKSDHVLEISDGTQIEAKTIVIATGSRTNVLPKFKELGDRLVVNDDVFYWESLPKSVAVFGPGVIGLEIGQALHRLGVKVVLFGRSASLGSISDPDVLKQATTIFSDEFPVYLQTDLVKFNNKGDSVEVEYKDKEGKLGKESFEYILAATGRVPNVDQVGLENTSVKLGKSGVPIFDEQTGRIGDSHIYIGGDVTNELPLLHEASDEGRIAGYNAIRHPKNKRFKKSSPIAVVFSDPQIMSIGQSHKELTDKKIDFKIGEVDFKGQGRSRVMLKNKGLLRVYGEVGSGRFLGAEMIGPSAEHVAHLLSWAHQSELTVSEILDRPFYHPVIEEGVRTAFRTLNKNLGFVSELPLREV